MKKVKTAKAAKDKQESWTKSNPDLAKKLASFIANETAAAVNWEGIQIKPGSATRATSGIILGEFAKKIDNMIVSSADLSNSDKTDGFLKGTKILKRAISVARFSRPAWRNLPWQRL